MRRKIASVWLCSLVIISFIAVLVQIAPIVSAKTWYVDDDGGGPFEDGSQTWPYDTIQEGVNAASPGDTVYVYSGTYNENVVVNKAISLTGENRATTTINGGGSGDTVYITQDWVNVTEFTVTGSGLGAGDAGIEIEAGQNCRIVDNTISSNSAGVFVWWFSNNNNISSNSISNNEYGIFIDDSDHNMVYFNDVTTNTEGIRISSNWANNNNILNNTVSGGTSGIYIYNADYNNITENDITGSTYGIHLSDSEYNTVKENTANNNNNGIYIAPGGNHNNILQNTANVNNDGIYVQGSYNDIDQNIINSNVNAGIFLDMGSYNNITRNNKSWGNMYGFRIKGFYNQIKYNTVYSNDRSGIFLDWAEYNNISDNVFSSNDNYGIETSFADFNDIMGNTILFNILNGIDMIDSDSNNLTDNTIEQNGDIGIRIIGMSDGNHIINNTLSDNEDGLYLDSSSNNNIIDNIVTWSNQNGIQVVSSSESDVINNTLANNGHGLGLSSSSGSKISGNIISTNTWNALNLSSSDNNDVLDNDISNNGYGVRLISSSNNNLTYNILSSNTVYGIHISDASTNNTFHHNNIMENGNQVYLMGSIDNNWDDGKGEGNYWSDYVGLDDGSGGRFAGDGVGDTEIPHPELDQGDGYFQLDNFPLITPVGNYITLHEGWNLVSIPWIQTDANLITVLNFIDGSYDAVQWYNVSDGMDPWKHNKTSKPSYMNDMDEIVHTIGFWIHITEVDRVQFEYSGSPHPENQTISLKEGWNLVGYPSLTKANRTEGLNNLTFDQEVDLIQWYDARAKTWNDMGENDYFIQGRGYWIHAKAEAAWDVPL